MKITLESTSECARSLLGVDAYKSNSKGEKVTIKAHQGPIDIEGVAVAIVNDKLQLNKVEVFFDPMSMFRQMAEKGNVTKEKIEEKVEETEA